MILTVGIKQKIFLDRNPSIFFTVVCLCATNQSKLSKNSAQAEFLCFCVFAGKNAVYLANQSCKDGKNEALCHKKTGITIPRIRLRRILGFWHTALAKQETGKQSQNSANAEFWSFCTRLLIKQELPDAKAKLCVTFSHTRP